MNKPWYKRWWGILVIIIVSFIFIILTAFGFYVADIVKQIEQGKIQNPNLINTGEAPIQDKELIEGIGNYWFGSPNPKITIVEFSDFSCPFCGKSYPKIREIGLKYKNDVKIIYRDFPIRESYSLDLSMAGRCAGEQGLFWLMHDKLFQNQGVSKSEELTELAKQIGADINRFSSCLKSKKYTSRIQKDFTDGETLGVVGTPTWFINGYKVEGDVPLAVWEEIIGRMTKE